MACIVCRRSGLLLCGEGWNDTLDKVEQLAGKAEQLAQANAMLQTKVNELAATKTTLEIANRWRRLRRSNLVSAAPKFSLFMASQRDCAR